MLSAAIELLLMRASSSASVADTVDSWRLSDTRPAFELRAPARVSPLDSNSHGREKIEKERP